jgi:outer membrane protein assembly factor BamD
MQKMRFLLLKLLILCSLLVAIQGCETLKNFNLFEKSSDDAKYADYDAERFQTEAKQAMADEKYQKAIELYEKLESRFPFGDHAAQTQLDIAFAYYKNDEPEAAIAAAERFIKVHPTNKSVDYAYYLRGLVNYNRGIGFLERFLPTDASQRDPGNAKDAFDNFAELLRRFPDSTYAPDSKQRMMYLRNNLAQYEVHVARYYMQREAYIAAANRAAYVVKKYQRTPAMPEALEIMQTAYLKLGLDDLAADANRVYQQNYPNGPPPPIARNDDSGIAHSVWDFIGFDN